MKLTIDAEFRDLIPPLSDTERTLLFESLELCRGPRDPIVVWQNMPKDDAIILDGHNRYEYCQKRGFDFEVVVKEFYTRDLAKNWMILNQLGRRNVTPETASRLRAEYQESISKGQGGNHNPEGAGGKSGKALSKSNNKTLTNDTTTEVAKATGVSRATVASDVRLMKALDELGISRADYAAGKVRDSNGKKRSKKSIIEEAFPPKPDKPRKAAPAAPADRLLDVLEIIPELS